MPPCVLLECISTLSCVPLLGVGLDVVMQLSTHEEEIGGTNIARREDVARVALVRFEVTLVPLQMLVSLHLFKLCNAQDVCGYTARGPSRDRVGGAPSLKQKVGDPVWLGGERSCAEVREVAD